MNARVQDGQIVSGLNALVIEAKRVSEFGFYASELDRAKRSMKSTVRGYQRPDLPAAGQRGQRVTKADFTHRVSSNTSAIYFTRPRRRLPYLHRCAGGGAVQHDSGIRP